MRTLRSLLLSLALTVVPAAPAAGAAPYLVKDIDPRYVPASSEPHELVSLGNLALFETGQDWDATQTLWRSDGTPAGTYPLLTARDTRLLALAADRAFLLVDPPGRFRSHLWVSDGTAAGTFQLTGNLLHVFEEPGIAAWVPGQHVLYFAAADASANNDAELWRTDGTPGGTYQVADIWPGADGSHPRELTKLKGRIYFVADDPEHGSALWSSDGTPQGTALVKDTAPGFDQLAGIHFLHSVGPRLVFVAAAPSLGSELWVSDGTPQGTRLLIELVAGDGSPRFLDFAVHGQRLYFVAVASADPAQELWVTDGTAKGTRLLAILASISGPLTPLPRSSPADRLVFVASDASHGDELWVTDGTAKGTRLVRDICPGPCSGATSPPVLHQGRLYFRATDGALGDELWATDGTKAGTRLVRDICPGSCSSRPSHLLTMRGRLLFLAEDRLHDRRLWATDGTPAGTFALTDADQTIFAFEGAKAGPMLIFSFEDPEHGREPWCTDGTPAGTFLIADLDARDEGGSFPGELMALGATAFFFADDGEHGYELWQSDGTAAGTSLVTELLPGDSPFSRPSVGSWTATHAWLIFKFSIYQRRSAQRPYFPYPPPPPHPWDGTLWASNGTAGGTWRLIPEDVDSAGPLSPPVVPLGSRVFFEAADKEHGYELWATDGTPAGTRLAADLVPGTDSSFPRDFVIFQDKLWFITGGGAQEANRLWRSDGTAAGSIAVGPTLGSIRSPTVYKGRLWFLASDAEHGTAVWNTDGRDAGTVPVIEGLSPSLLFTDGERLYFTDRTFGEARGLWASDGTAAGTHKISDQETCGLEEVWAVFGGRLFYAGSPECELVVSDRTAAGTRVLRTAEGLPLKPVANLVPLGNRLLVATGEGELWQTDGTDAGTTLITRRLSLGYTGTPELLRAGSRVFFPAIDPETGWELWAIQE